jgi:hypothetical protein
MSALEDLPDDARAWTPVVGMRLQHRETRTFATLQRITLEQGQKRYHLGGPTGLGGRTEYELRRSWRPSPRGRARGRA